MPAGRGESEGELLSLCGDCPRLLTDTGPCGTRSPAPRQEPVALPGVFANLANNLPFELLGSVTESTQALESWKKPSPAAAFSPSLGCTVAGAVMQPTGSSFSNYLNNMSSAPRMAQGAASVCWSWRASRWPWRLRWSVSHLQTPGAMSGASSTRYGPWVCTDASHRPVVDLSCHELVTGQALTLDSRWTPQLGHIPRGVPVSHQGFLYSNSIAHFLLFHPGIPEFQF